MSDNTSVFPEPPAQPKKRSNAVKITGIIVGGIVVLALIGSWSKSGDATLLTEPSTTTTTTATEAPADTPAQRVRMLSEAETTWRWSSDTTDTDIDKIGAKVCDFASTAGMLEYGLLIQQMQKELGVSREDAAQLVGFFIGAYCPENAPE